MAERVLIDMKGIEVDQNPDAPLIYVDGIQGFSFTEPNLVRINLVQDLLLSPPAGEVITNPQRRVAARLVMTVEQFAAIQQWINDVMSEMKKDGAVKTNAPL